jgi:hypothetical protein
MPIRWLQHGIFGGGGGGSELKPVKGESFQGDEAVIGAAGGSLNRAIPEPSNEANPGRNRLVLRILQVEWRGMRMTDFGQGTLDFGPGKRTDRMRNEGADT